MSSPSIPLESQTNNIYDIINRCHNPLLVDTSECPSANIIYHIYSDGEITFQRGSWAYSHKTEYPEKDPMNIKMNTEKFPLKTNSRGYAIVTHSDAIMIRNLMGQLL